VSSRFMIMTTNCFGAAINTSKLSGGFIFDLLIAGHSMFLNFPVFIGRVQPGLTEGTRPRHFCLLVNIASAYHS